MRFRLLQILSFGLWMTVCALGCGGSQGPKLGNVTGTVTLDGAPVPKLTIRFIPETSGGSPSYGATNAKGQYTLMYSQNQQGAMLGKHQVEIEPIEPEVGDDGKPINTDQIPKIPGRYRKAGTLSADVKSGKNSFDFRLDSKSDAAN